MSSPCDCPSCKADLRDGKIPEESKHCYGKETEYFSKVIGLYDERKDRTTHWLCPICGYKWERK